LLSNISLLLMILISISLIEGTVLGEVCLSLHEYTYVCIFRYVVESGRGLDYIVGLHVISECVSIYDDSL
jgi:hypothetical protein